MAERRPKLGDRISYDYPPDSPLEGVVELLLTTQFVFRTDEGVLAFCFYNDPWRVV